MESYTYYNGEFGKTEDIKIPLSDRAIYFGDGIYDAAIGKDGKIFLKDEHICRFLSNAKRLSIKGSPSYTEISDLLTLTVQRAALHEYFVYFQLTRDSKRRIHSAAECTGSNLMITVSELRPIENHGTVALMTHPDMRYGYCDIKTLNLLPAVLASTSAEEAGCDEVVFHRGATVTECAHSNIAILKSGTLYTHPLSNLILPGITRRHMLMACESLGIPYRERSFTLDELYSADEVLISSTTTLCRRARSVNGIPTGEKDSITAERIQDFLCNEYREM